VWSAVDRVGVRKSVGGDIYIYWVPECPQKLKSRVKRGILIFGDTREPSIYIYTIVTVTTYGISRASYPAGSPVLSKAGPSLQTMLYLTF
jgi:hypothetical protein